MIKEKLFLNSSITLGEIADKLSVIPRYLSQVINELKGQNFYDFVNSYRIEEAKRILSDPSHNEEKILAVLLLLFASSIIAQSDDGFDEEECSFNGIKLNGKIQFVESFPDLTVQVVESFPDLKVKIVDSFPDDCGEWQIPGIP